MKKQNAVVSNYKDIGKMRINILTRKAQGIALLEVLVAMLVFALAVLPLVKLQLMSSEATMAGYYKTETSSLAQSLMEVIQKDKKNISDWNDVNIYAGQKCNAISKKAEKLACNILNNSTASIHSAKNAVICIKAREASNTPDTAVTSLNPIDAYEVDLYAIWYAGKRNKQVYDQDLDDNICGDITVDKVKKEYLSKENLDAIIFKQVI